MSSYRGDIAAGAGAGFIPWEKLVGKTLLVTGASGLIGGAVVDIVSAGCPGCRIIAGGRNVARMQKRFPNVEIWQQDLSNVQPEDFPTFDYAVHAAGAANPALYSKHPVEVITTAFHSLEAMLRRNSAGGRILFVSSDEVYGQCDKMLISESDSGYVDCTSARSCYPSAKRLCESLCASYVSEYGADIVTVRPSHVYGPYFTDQDNRVYAQFIRNAINGEDIVMKSRGEQMRSWCYSADCASAILTVLLKGETGEAYNIADNNSEFTIRDLAGMISGICGTSIRMECPPEEESRGYNPVKRSVLSTRKLESLGWRPLETSAREKLASTIFTQKQL